MYTYLILANPTSVWNFLIWIKTSIIKILGCLWVIWIIVYLLKCCVNSHIWKLLVVFQFNQFNLFILSKPYKWYKRCKKYKHIYIHVYTNCLDEQSWIILLVENKSYRFKLWRYRVVLFYTELVFDNKLQNLRVFGWK